MRTFNRFSAVLAVIALGAPACGDDEGTTGKTDTTSTTDSTTTTDSTVTTTDATTAPDSTTTAPDGDVVVANPCDPNPCTTAPAASCDGNQRVTFTAPGTCTNDDGSAVCAYAETKTACGEGNVCSAGACVAAGNACDYTFGNRVSYVTEVRVGNQNKPQGSSTYVDACCFDLGGPDDKIDNALGVLMVAIASFVPGFELNGTLKEQIADGSLVLLLETNGVTDVSNQTNVTINGFYGEIVSGEGSPTAGTGHFLADSASFIEGTKTPLINFAGASIVNSVLGAGPATFKLAIPLLGAVVNLDVSQTRLEALVAAGPNGNGLTMTGSAIDPETEEAFGAKLGGSINLAELANALNTYMAASCSCVEDGNTATPGIFIVTETATQFKLACEAGWKKDNCEAGECVLADNLTLVCSAGPALINPDIDLDDDGVRESLSVGVFLKATSATIDGVSGCER